MEHEKVRKVGGACAVLLGASYVLVAISYLMLPAQQKGGTLLHEPEKYLESVARSSTWLVVNHLTFGIGALLGIAVVIAVLDFVRSAEPGWMPWMSALGILGFAVTAIDNFQIASVDPARAAQFVRADETGRTVVAMTGGLVSIDPEMWLSFGLTGLWIISVSVVTLRRRIMPPVHAALGLVSAACYLFVEIGTVLDSPILMVVSAVAGGLLAGPVWYVWMGMVLRRAGEAGAVAGTPAAAHA